MIKENMTTDYKITEQQHHWTSEEKLKYCGYGEWVEEADSTEIEYLGYEAMIFRVFHYEPYTKKVAYFGGHLCGYVKISNNHPFYKKKGIYLECHGGITANEIHEDHWIGFDCAHLGDIVPTTEHFKRTSPEWIEIQKKNPIPLGFENHHLFNPTYKNIEFCIEECKSMIAQLIVEEEIKVEKEAKNAPRAKTI